MISKHDWKLVGPWYRWHDPDQIALPAPLPDDSHAGDAALGRASRPILQKYAASSFVDDFLRDPRCSLRYDQKDFVHQVVTLNASEVSKRSLSNKAYRKLAANRRKVFLNTHSRFYLVVCELHCDTAGFPNVRPEDVCEAGFVVRRRTAPVPDAVRPQFESVLSRISRARFQLASVRRKSLVQRGRAQWSPRTLAANALQAARQRQTCVQTRQLEQAQVELQTLVQQHGVQRQVEGWLRRPNGSGEWRPLDDELPQQIAEEVLPLYPLLPDPNDTSHMAAGRCLWFGVLPTGSADVDPAGNARFDDRQTYEVRCFVRRHDPGCPKKSERSDCQGEVVWSRATEGYQLASQFDLDGTSNRVVTIQLPDLAALEAQVSGPDFKMGQGVGVAMVTPGSSELPFTVDDDGNPQKSGNPSPLPSICFFSIPLITIVATFVLRLFLPIVVFLFGLWFLLRLKFCILPTVSIGGGLSADLDLALDVDLSAELDLDLQLQLDIAAALGANFPGHQAEELKKLDPRAQGQLLRDLATDFRQSAPDGIDFSAAPPVVRSGALPGEDERTESYCLEESA